MKKKQAKNTLVIGVYNLPTMITFGGLILALTAVFLSFAGHIELALIALIYAGICDMFDGMIARRMKLDLEEREFGVQIDSIIDMASFGCTPALIGLHSGLDKPFDYPILTLYCSCAAMRLAYFNVHGLSDEGGRSYYTGLPVTYAAMIFPLVYAVKVFAPEMAFDIIIRLTFLGVAATFVLQFKIPKPTGIFYWIFPSLAILMTIFWTYNI